MGCAASSAATRGKSGGGVGNTALLPAASGVANSTCCETPVAQLGGLSSSLCTPTRTGSYRRVSESQTPGAEQPAPSSSASQPVREPPSGTGAATQREGRKEATGAASEGPVQSGDQKSEPGEQERAKKIRITKLKRGFSVDVPIRFACDVRFDKDSAVGGAVALSLFGRQRSDSVIEWIQSADDEIDLKKPEPMS
ncbi:conserved hypothetical protein [Neospora caninum Liverpool]|uniref:Uncharacterized protein n=1 Tax=Neospora caninum (strain Liverpool) TaxID=572307 RepID=F0VDD2_NEOCL|nr:conserved hypothetical protein [Neospora caninum Liverpool]CBZ51647.1 conserved hypothetical protein [Neospora caninum Liverpool]CEL65601.1 TPA: hypothetical protein BN1204_014410 [Neospora caninum Liverpool]|eukprot:XP_003881680.1 conserved hypothetical protein [Neospora caninum Liverpool]